jgi:hypothetical protein
MNFATGSWSRTANLVKLDAKIVISNLWSGGLCHCKHYLTSTMLFFGECQNGNHHFGIWFVQILLFT